MGTKRQIKIQMHFSVFLFFAVFPKVTPVSCCTTCPSIHIHFHVRFCYNFALIIWQHLFKISRKSQVQIKLWQADHGCKRECGDIQREEGMQWKMALVLLSEMKNRSLKPDVNSYNASISACENTYLRIPFQICRSLKKIIFFSVFSII